MKKKFLAILIAFLSAFCFAGCDMFTPPSGESGGQKPPVAPGPGEENPDDGNGKEEYGESFTVKLVYNNKAYYPGTSVQAKWTEVNDLGDIVNIPVTAPFSKSGIAAVTGLDGNYRVTLSQMPNDYTYNPNIYFASNENKDIEITLYKLNRARNTGENWYQQAINVSTPGAYRLTIESADQLIRFKYQPTKNGIYTLESFADIVSNEINPTLEIWSGNVAYVTTKDFDVEAGGSSSSFTRNFKYEILMSDSNLGGLHCFAVRAASKVGYPITFDYVIRYESPYNPDLTLPDAIPQEFYPVFTAAHLDEVLENYRKEIEPSVRLQLEASLKDRLDAILDEDERIKFLNDAVETALDKAVDDKIKADNLQVYSAGSAAVTNKKSQIAALMKASGTTYKQAYNSNKAFKNSDFKLWKKEDGGDGYYHVWNQSTETYGAVLCANITKDIANILVTDSGQGFLDSRISYRHNGKNYESFIKDYYAAYAADGRYPVTEELKEFLQAYAIAAGLFMDGNGYLEKDENGNPLFSASEKSQWLFACGYYG